jgi:phosphatidylglycerol lysyltransferase
MNFTTLATGTRLEALERWSDHPCAFLALNEETRAFRAPGLRGFIAYRPCGGWLFQLGSPFAPDEDRAALLEAFRGFAGAERRKVCALQLRPGDVELYREAGFRVNQLGTSYTVELERFTTKGSRFMQLRNKVNRARKDGVKVAELGVDLPRAPAITGQQDALTARWLESKGRHRKLLDFMVGETGGAHDDLRRTFVAMKDERLLAFVTYVPAWGELGGVLHDLSRRVPDAPPGVMELVNTTAIDRFKAEGLRHLNFGLTPFVGVGDATDRIPGRSAAVSWLLRKLAVHGGAVYPARSQAAYKLKWDPTVIVPEYFAFEGRFELGCLFRLLVLTRSI